MGEPPEPAVLAVAAEAALAIPPDTEARQFAPETDIVRADLVLVMDKYTAADVLREVPLRAAPMLWCMACTWC